MRYDPYFEGSHEKFVVDPSRLGAPKDAAVLDKFTATAYVYMVDLFDCTTAVGIPSTVMEVRLLEP